MQRDQHLAYALLPLLLLGACGGSEPLAEPADDEPVTAAAPTPYHVYVTNEGSGDLTVIAGGTHEVLATIPLMMTAGEQRRQRLKSLLLGTACVGIPAAMIAGVHVFWMKLDLILARTLELLQP